MNILLVYPEYPDTFWSFKHVLKFISKKAAFPPLGLLTVASMLPKEWGKRLVDLNVHELTDEQIAWADMVMISGMIVQKESASEVAKKAKKLGRTVVAGGPLFTTGHKTFKNVDHFVLNEAEVTLPMFLKDLERGELKKVYTSAERPDITKTPLPMWKLINFKDYVTIGIQHSRGCPFNCEFCDIVLMNGRVPRTKTTEQILAELDSLYAAGWRGSVFIVDDNFIGNKAVIKKMLPKLINWQKNRKYPFSFLTEASMNLADDEDLMQMMSSANFCKVFLGIETPNLESLKECTKFQNTNRNLADNVKKIQQHGLQVMGGFIVGFDSDGEDIFDRQIKFIQQTGIVTAMVGLLNALPHTRLWNRLKDEDRLVAEMSGDNTDGSINFIPKMSVERLINGYKKIISNIYSPKQYYKRIDTMVKNYKPSVKIIHSLPRLGAFFHSTWKIGVLSNSRFYYWGLLFKTTFTRIKCLDVVIEAAIYGYHFERIAKKIIASRHAVEDSSD